MQVGGGGAVGAGAADVRISAASTRPVVLPEILEGTNNWNEWIFHFESVAAVNEWNDTDKLK